MKLKLLFITLSIILLPSLLKAQDVSYLPGYIVTVSNDTIYGFVRVKDQGITGTISEIGFQKTAEAAEEVYAPVNLIGFKLGDKTYESHLSPDFDGFNEFMELVTNGPIKVYQLKTRSMGMETSVSSFLRKQEEATLFDPDKGTFKVEMANYLADNKSIAKKIKSGAYKRRDLDKILAEYNDWKSKK